MGKFDGWLICSDFDGTLYINKQIAEEDIRAIRYFQSEGGLFTFASGRFAHMLDSMGAGITPNAPMATMNGAIICGGKEEEGSHTVLYRGGIERDRATSFAFDIYDRYDSVMRLVFYTWDGSIEYCRAGDPPSDRKKFVSVLPDVIPKMAIYIQKEEATELFHLIRQEGAELYNTTRSWAQGIELNRVSDSKGVAVRTICRMTGSKHLVCVGDYDNDVDMIRAADIGYAVGNAVESLKAAADRVTVSAADHAIAAIIEEIGAEIDAGVYDKATEKTKINV